MAPDQIVIAVRGADDETDILRETLAAACIPTAGTLRAPFSRMPLVRALLTLLETELGGLVPSTALSLCCAPITSARMVVPCGRPGVKTAIRMLRKGKLAADRRHILHRVSSVAEEGKTPADRSDATTGRRPVTRLVECDRAPESAGDIHRWIDRVVSLCDELGIAPRENNGGPSAIPSPDDDLAKRDAELGGG